MNNDFTSLTENPEYQKAMRKLLATPPSIRALVPTGDVDAAFMKDQMQKDLQLETMGLNKTNQQRKLNLMEQGLGTSKAYYNFRTSAAEDVLDLTDRANTFNNIMGVTNLGLSGLGAYKNYQLSKKIV